MDANEQSKQLDLRAILVGEGPVQVARLYQLSDMTPENIEEFSEIWSKLDSERRRVIVRHLADISEGHYEVDYNDVFAHCLGDPLPAVRIAALDGLWDSERVVLIKPILDLAQNDPDLEVRRLAAATLGHYVLLGEWDQIPQRHTQPIIEGLLLILEDEDNDPSVRRAALESIASAPHVKVAGYIEQAYDSGDYRMQLSAIYAMGQSADPRWLHIVLDELQSPYEEMRIEAVRAAGSIGRSEAVSDVADLITDDDLEVRLASVTALAEIGSGLGKQILLELLDDPDMEELHAVIGEALEGMSWMDLDFDFDHLDWDNE